MTMKNSNHLFLLLFFFAFSFVGKAQESVNLTDAKKQKFIANWYESPKESKGDTLVFRKTKYVLDANDSKAFAFSVLNFTDLTNFKIEYWRWCTALPYAYTGSWSATASSLNLDFGQGKCSNTLKVLSIDANSLKVIIKEN